MNLSYQDGLFRYHEPNAIEMSMQALTSGHLTIDLSEVPKNANAPAAYAISQVPASDSASSSLCTAADSPRRRAMEPLGTLESFEDLNGSKQGAPEK